MPFEKGTSGNIHGRKQGTPNKATQLQREFVQSLLDSQQKKVTRELKKLRGKDYISAITALMEFTIPKLQRTELKTNATEGPKQYFVIGGQKIEF